MGSQEVQRRMQYRGECFEMYQGTLSSEQEVLMENKEVEKDIKGESMEKHIKGSNLRSHHQDTSKKSMS